MLELLICFIHLLSEVKVRKQCVLGAPCFLCHITGGPVIVKTKENLVDMCKLLSCETLKRFWVTTVSQTFSSNQHTRQISSPTTSRCAVFKWKSKRERGQKALLSTSTECSNSISYEGLASLRPQTHDMLRYNLHTDIPVTKAYQRRDHMHVPTEPNLRKTTPALHKFWYLCFIVATVDQHQ